MKIIKISDATHKRLDDSNIIKGHEYYCIGCDETYKLQKVSDDEKKRSN